MRIDYCPKCNKAGLKYFSNWANPHFGDYHFEGNKVVNDFEQKTAPDGYGTAKWCPRCKEWVKPENHPYIGMKGKV